MLNNKKVVTLSENAQKITESRYFQEGEDWFSCIKRVSKAISVVEGDKREEYEGKFFDLMYYMDFLPGGRIIRNAGKSKGTLLNCFVLGFESDSIESIGKFYADSLTLSSEGGGVGASWSKLRPKGFTINGKGGTSSGLVSFMIASDALASTIESGGSRRAAYLGCVEVSHPEIVDFINCKLVDGKLSHYNISVIINEEFLKCVESDGVWTFKFNQIECGNVRAKELWYLIMDNMCKHAEPGLLNGTNMCKNNSYYFDPISSPNPCGEHLGGVGSSCCLGSLVLPKFITGEKNTNWQKLEYSIRLAVRFLDNVIDINKYALPEVDASSHRSRRIGLGTMGLADYLFAKNLRYGSKEALVEVDKLYRFIRDKVYEASIELAKERGSFPAFDSVLFGGASFVRKLPAKIRMDIKRYGIRNVTAMAQAPTGTISLIADTSSGIEPLIYKSYKRNDRVGERVYIHPKYKQLLLSGNKIPDWFVDMNDLKPEDHLETMAVIQKYTDGAVSKSINMPKGTTTEQLSLLLLEYIRELKGVTVYVDGSRDGQIYQNLTESEALEYVRSEQVVSNVLVEDDVECNCQKREDGSTTCNLVNKNKEITDENI